MSAITIPVAETSWRLPDRGKVAMAALIVAESAIFTIFVVAYLFYVGKSLTGPAPRDVLEVPVFFTVCLLSSSITVHFADRALKRDHRGTFVSLWFLTFFLGATFLFGTAQEWRRLIYERGFTISTNLFGTTYYSLVGLHAFHVTAGLLIFLVVLVFALAGRVDRGQVSRIGVIAMYWHFVDSVWIVVFTVVYVLGR